MPQNQTIRALCGYSVAVLGVSSAQGSSQAPPVPDTAPSRLLVEEVQLLRPSAIGLVASEPVDVLLVDGRVASVCPGLDVQLEPGEVRLRGQGRWLLPAPRARVTGDSLHSSDLVVAGLSGIGALAVDPEKTPASALHARAALDTTALPLLLGPDAQVEGTLEVGRGALPTLSRLASSEGGTEALLAALAGRADDPFAVGSNTAFLLLLEDPRANPEAILDSHAVLVGQGYVLRSERLVRLEEAANGQSIAKPPAGEAALPKGGWSWSRRYRLVIDGIERGTAVLDAQEEPSGVLHARVRARVAAPADETIIASAQWPSGRAQLHQVTPGVSITARTDTTGEGAQLEVLIDGDPVEESPVALKPSDRFLPHTLLVLLDALRGDGEAEQFRVVEIDFLDGPISVRWSKRRTARALGPDDRPVLDGRRALELAGPDAAELMLFPWSEEADEVALVVLDTQRRPLSLLVETPWGTVEWAALVSPPTGQPPSTPQNGVFDVETP